jgi:cytoskeletal protein CcmA (bactofilin family)
MFGFGKKKRRSIDKVRTYTTEIGPDAVFEGKVQGEGNYAVRGKMVGESDISGTILLRTEGEWIGNVLADVVIIAGTVRGNVMAREKIELQVTGRVEGDLEAPALAIAEGAIYDGKIKMAKAANVTRYQEKRGMEEKTD